MSTLKVEFHASASTYLECFKNKLGQDLCNKHKVQVINSESLFVPTQAQEQASVASSTFKTCDCTIHFLTKITQKMLKEEKNQHNWVHVWSMEKIIG